MKDTENKFTISVGKFLAMRPLGRQRYVN